MTAQDVDSFTVDTITDLLPRPLRTDEGVAVNAVKDATTEDALQKLIEEEEVDYDHDGERGIGAVREAVLESELASKDLKQTVASWKYDREYRGVLDNRRATVWECNSVRPHSLTTPTFVCISIPDNAMIDNFEFSNPSFGYV